MSTRIVGIDLAVTAKHLAAVLDPATNQFVVKRMAFGSLPDDLDHVLERARSGAGADTEIVVVLEATSLAWHPISLYLACQGAKVYRVNGRMTGEMRRVRNPHARSDTLDCQALASLYTACPDRLAPLHIPSGEQMALQRACREYYRGRQVLTAIDNRLTAYDHWAWQGLDKLIPAKALSWVRREWYDPWKVVAAGYDKLTAAWWLSPLSKNESDDWIQPWLERAAAIVRLFGQPDAIDFTALSATLNRNLERQTQIENANKQLYDAVIAPLYRRLYPNCHLTSIYGIGEASAATYMAFIHSIDRFPNVQSFRQWTGMVPAASQSGNAEAKGLHLTQAGHNLIKATLYLDANIARQWDPQFANIYYNQMVSLGKHHTQALCACASHLANRIYTVLKQNRPYELRNLDDKAISVSDARTLIRERFVVPAEIRRRTTKHAHRQSQPVSTA